MKREALIVWFAIFLLWAFYRAYVYVPEWVDEFVAKPLIFLAPVVWAVTVWEKKKLSSIGFTAAVKDIFIDVYIGVVIGIVFAFEGVLVNYYKYGDFSFTPIAQVAASAGILSFLFVNLATSISEEIVGRGYLFQRFFWVTGNQLSSALFSSFLFLLLHVPIMFTRLHLTGNSLVVYPVSIFLLGVVNCYLLSIRKSLLLPILVHLFWNMTVALYL